MPKPKSVLYHKRWTLRLFEWGVLSCIILILVGVFLHKARSLQAEAERLNVQATIDNMRAAALLASVLHKDNGDVRFHVRPGGNPARLLKAETGLEPDGYLGEMDGVDPAEIAAGKWYFDREQRALIYRLRSAEGFQSPLSGPARIRLCLNKGGTTTANDVPLVVEPCEKYEWAQLD